MPPGSTRRVVPKSAGRGASSDAGVVAEACQWRPFVLRNGQHARTVNTGVQLGRWGSKEWVDDIIVIYHRICIGPSFPPVSDDKIYHS